MVVWILGLSASGKTAIGKEVYKQIKSGKENVVFLDGDIFRDIMGNDLGHTIQDRRTNAGRISRFCQYLDSQGIDVVCTVLSIFPDWLKWNRVNISEYFEVYIRVPFEVLLTRETKGLYSSALAGEKKNVVGVDIEFPEPVCSDLVIDNSATVDSFESLASEIVEAIKTNKIEI
jgi:adenylylsulfate kinase